MLSFVTNVKNSVAEGISGRSSKQNSRDGFSLDQTPDLTGKVAVVTGGSEGLGYGLTYTLLKHNIQKLYILTVAQDVAQGAKEAIAKDLGKEVAERTVWLQCELSDWPRVKDVAEQIKNSTDRLDILINNAAHGIMAASKTDYGVDRHMAVNHMGHVILTSHLLPLMKKTAESGSVVRIVNQSSSMHKHVPPKVSFASLEEINHDAGPGKQYGRSKLAGILYARYFTRKVTQQGHPDVLMNATHPGFTGTRMHRADIREPFPFGGYALSPAKDPFKKDQLQGAVSTIFAATKAEGSGDYICPPDVVEPGSKLSQDEALGDRLMELTRGVVMEKTKRASVDKGCPFDDLVLH